MRERLAVMAVILLGEKRQLVAAHQSLLSHQVPSARANEPMPSSVTPTDPMT
jgi:hypothetical protein